MYVCSSVFLLTIVINQQWNISTLCELETTSLKGKCEVIVEKLYKGLQFVRWLQNNKKCYILSKTKKAPIYLTYRLYSPFIFCVGSVIRGDILVVNLSFKILIFRSAHLLVASVNLLRQNAFSVALKSLSHKLVSGLSENGVSKIYIYLLK